MHNKEPYQDLIDEIKKDGEEAIESIVDRESESYFLDYKKAKSKDYSKERSLGDSDIKNLSKAISGFGNSAGGILIFGVNDDGSKNPFQGYEKFKELILSSISRLTNPSHDKVHAFSVQSNEDNKGYVVIEVSKTNFAPLQTISKNAGYRYYMRSGESFVDVPHDVLAGMFGKRPNPKLGYIFNVDDELDLHEGSIDNFAFRIMIMNFGSVTVRNLWVNMWVGGVPNMHYNLTGAALNVFEGHNLQNLIISVIAKDSYKMPPQSPMTVFEVFIPKQLPKVYQGDDFEFHFSFGCDGSMPYEFKAEWTRDEYKNFPNYSIKDFLEFLKEKNNNV